MHAVLLYVLLVHRNGVLLTWLIPQGLGICTVEKQTPILCSVQEVRYLLRRWWTTRVQNQLKSETQIMSVLWKAEESRVSGDDKSNRHTYPEAELEVTGWHPSSIITLSPSPAAYLLDGTAHTRGVLQPRFLSSVWAPKWQILLRFIWYA